MIELLVAVLIFTAIIGTVASSVSSPNANITGGALALYGLITLIMVALFVVFLTNQFQGKK